MSARNYSRDELLQFAADWRAELAVTSPADPMHAALSSAIASVERLAASPDPAGALQAMRERAHARLQ